MTLKQTIQDAVKDAMRAKDTVRLSPLRMLTAAIKQIEIDEQVTLDDPGIVAVLRKMIKQRKDSIEQYRQGHREDLAQVEEAEITVLSTFLPVGLSDAELDAMIGEVIAETQATSPRDIGKVMPLIRERVAGRADMGTVSAKVKARLS